VKALDEVPLEDCAPAVGPKMYVDHLIDQPAVFYGSRDDLSERDFVPEKKAYGT
jgi:hypothetical protein